MKTTQMQDQETAAPMNEMSGNVSSRQDGSFRGVGCNTIQGTGIAQAVERRAENTSVPLINLTQRVIKRDAANPTLGLLDALARIAVNKAHPMQRAAQTFIDCYRLQVLKEMGL